MRRMATTSFFMSSRRAGTRTTSTLFPNRFFVLFPRLSSVLGLQSENVELYGHFGMQVVVTVAACDRVGRVARVFVLHVAFLTVH